MSFLPWRKKKAKQYNPTQDDVDDLRAIHDTENTNLYIPATLGSLQPASYVERTNTHQMGQLVHQQSKSEKIPPQNQPQQPQQPQNTQCGWYINGQVVYDMDNFFRQDGGDKGQAGLAGLATSGREEGGVYYVEGSNGGDLSSIKGAPLTKSTSNLTTKSKWSTNHKNNPKNDGKDDSSQNNSKSAPANAQEPNSPPIVNELFGVRVRSGFNNLDDNYDEEFNDIGFDEMICYENMFIHPNCPQEGNQTPSSAPNPPVLNSTRSYVNSPRVSRLDMEGQTGGAGYSGQNALISKRQGGNGAVNMNGIASRPKTASVPIASAPLPNGSPPKVVLDGEKEGKSVGGISQKRTGQGSQYNHHIAPPSTPYPYSNDDKKSQVGKGSQSSSISHKISPNDQKCEHKPQQGQNIEKKPQSNHNIEKIDYSSIKNVNNPVAFNTLQGHDSRMSQIEGTNKGNCNVNKHDGYYGNNEPISHVEQKIVFKTAFGMPVKVEKVNLMSNNHIDDVFLFEPVQRKTR
jgi:hypothetical protein